MRSTSDAFDELAALFLTDDEDGGSAHPLTERASIQLLITGHLPVMAGLWLTQYADLVGRESGPTALIRFDETEVSLEILRAGGRRVGIDGAPTLREAIRSAARFVERWVIRPDPRLSVGSLLESEVEPVTLLTGADEAAVVAAYRSIKDLVETAVASEVATPNIGLCLLGAPPERVHAVVEKLNRTANTFLGIDLPLVASLQRMESIESAGQVVFPRRGSGPSSPPTMAEVVRWIRTGSTYAGERLEARATEATSRRLNGPVDDGPSIAHSDPALLEVVEPSPTVAPFGVDEPDRDRHESSPRGGERPWRQARTPLDPHRSDPPEIETTTAPATAPPEPTLVEAPTDAVDAGDVEESRLATAIGLTPLDLECPDAAGVELAQDRRGRLHLVAPIEKIPELMAAAAWTRRHRSLLARAFGETIRELDAPVLDAVTSSPLAASALHGSEINLHLRVLVETESGKGVWYVAPLNAPAR